MNQFGFMEAMLGISLYSYLFLKLEKLYVFLIISYVFSSAKLENRGPEASGVGWGGGSKQCIHM
jgi:hypothetical protein